MTYESGVYDSFKCRAKISNDTNSFICKHELIVAREFACKIAYKIDDSAIKKLEISDIVRALTLV